MSQEEANQVMNHRRLWSAHLNPLSTELQGILKDLAGRTNEFSQAVLSRTESLSNGSLTINLCDLSTTFTTEQF